VTSPVVEVDIGELLGVLCNGEQTPKTAPVLRGGFVMVPFRCSETDASLELGVGIYGDVTIAQQALRRSTPSAPRWTDPPIGYQHFVSSKAIHVRSDNVILFIPTDIPGSLSDLTEKLVTILADDDILKRGARVRTPAVEVVAFEKDANGNYTSTLRVQDKTNMLVAHGRSTDPGEYVVRATQFFMDPEFSVRVARITGEILVIPESRFPEEVRRDSSEGTDKRSVNYESHLAALQTSTGQEQARHLRVLADLGIPELQPVFEEFLSGTSHTVVKEQALRGLARIRRAEGIDAYRQIAADNDQPELIRRDAVNLIRKLGSSDDLELLLEIAQSTNQMQDLDLALDWAIRRLSGEPVR